MEIREMITEIKGRLDTRGGLKAVIFVACGGSQAAIYPGKYLLEREANEIAVSIYNSNEFNYVTPKSLDERCIVICCSLKATAETVHAVERARQFGAVTIAMTGSPGVCNPDSNQVGHPVIPVISTTIFPYPFSYKKGDE